MGTEPGKIRPVVVVQTDLLNAVHPSTVICPLTTNIQPQARFLRVHLGVEEAGLKEQSDIMVDQICAIETRRLLAELGKVTRRTQKKLAANIKILLAYVRRDRSSRPSSGFPSIKTLPRSISPPRPSMRRPPVKKIRMGGLPFTPT